MSRAVAEGRSAPVGFRMPGAPVANWLVVAFLVLVAVFLGFDPSTRVTLYVAPVWFGLLIVAYRLIGPRTRPALSVS
jgi:AAT family amino acid transporter